MKQFNIELLKEELLEKHPQLSKHNKRFWKFEFVSLVNNFLETHKDLTIIHEEDSPFQVERCPKCSVMVTYADSYCNNCGTNFEWR